MGVIELKIAQEIQPGTQVIDETEVIPSGRLINVYIYEASCPDSALAYSKLMYGSDILWGIQRGEKAPVMLRLEGDGVSKLQLICVNECGTPYHFNAYAKVGVADA
jgi:hypothetical protein